jgi:LysM repeat protein
MKKHAMLYTLVAILVLLCGCGALPVEGKPELPTPPPVPTPTSPPPIFHVVVPGDVVSAIATAYGVSEAVLVAANDLADPDLIYVGQRLFVPNPALRPAQPAGKRIIINLTQQRLYAYEGTSPVLETPVTTGRPGSETLAGTFAVQSKLETAYSSYYRVQMPYWLGIYWAGALENGIHTMPRREDGTTGWDDNLGTPSTPGCVILGYDSAARLYRWAEVGTPVVIAY